MISLGAEMPLQVKLERKLMHLNSLRNEKGRIKEKGQAKKKFLLQLPWDHIQLSTVKKDSDPELLERSEAASV